MQYVCTMHKVTVTWEKVWTPNTNTSFEYSSFSIWSAQPKSRTCKISQNYKLFESLDNNKLFPCRDCTLQLIVLLFVNITLNLFTAGVIMHADKERDDAQEFNCAIVVWKVISAPLCAHAYTLALPKEHLNTSFAKIPTSIYFHLFGTDWSEQLKK